MTPDFSALKRKLVLRQICFNHIIIIFARVFIFNPSTEKNIFVLSAMLIIDTQVCEIYQQSSGRSKTAASSLAIPRNNKDTWTGVEQSFTGRETGVGKFSQFMHYIILFKYNWLKSNTTRTV